MQVILPYAPVSRIQIHSLQAKKIQIFSESSSFSSFCAVFWYAIPFPAVVQVLREYRSSSASTITQEQPIQRVLKAHRADNETKTFVRFQVLCGTELSSFQAACGSSPSSRHPYWRTIWPFWPNVYKCYLLYASRTYVNDTNAFGSTNLSINRWQSHLRINCKDGDRCYDFAREHSKAEP